MNETDISNGIRLELSNQGIQNFRNNNGALPDKYGRLVKYGLMPGSGDIIGILPHKIRPEDVGKTVGIFTSIEVKTPKGKATEAQSRWMNMINEAGGLACIIRDADEVEAAITAGPPALL